MLKRRLTYCIIFCTLIFGFIYLNQRAKRLPGIRVPSQNSSQRAGAMTVDPHLLLKQMQRANQFQRKRFGQKSLNVTIPAQEIHKVLAQNNLYKYEKLEKLFNNGVSPRAGAWNRDLILLGRCVNKFDPETSIGAYADLYVIKLRSGKKRLYFVPSLDASIDGNQEFRALASKQHGKGKSRLKEFIPLGSKIPFDERLSMLIAQKVENMLFFRYRKRGVEKQVPEESKINEFVIPDSVAQGTKLGEKIFYGLRILTMPNGKRLLLLSYMCGSYPRCFSGKGQAKRFVTRM